MKPPSSRLLAAGILVVLGIAGVLTAALPGASSTPRDEVPRTSVRPTSPPRRELPPARTFKGPAFDPTLVRSPTATKSQSKLWFADGRWWGLFAAAGSNEFRIYGLAADGGWRDTGTLVDERPFALVDSLWDGERLYVLSVGVRRTPEHGARLYRFRLDDGRYLLDADFPVAVTDHGAESIVLDKDSSGRLWATYTRDGRIVVVASDGDDHHWGAPFTPAIAGSQASRDDISALVAIAPDAIGLMWSNQLDGSVYFAAHRDADPVDVWQPSEAVLRGLKRPDDHISMRADRLGRLYVAVKTSQGDLPNPNPLAPQILLLVRGADGDWQQYVVGRVKDRHTRPIVLYDESAGEIFIAATTPTRGGEIRYKVSSATSITFETGTGTPLVASVDDPTISNATSTKQALTAASGLVVLASDNATGRYLHGVLGLGTSSSGPSPGGGSEPVANTVTMVVNDTFDAWRRDESLPRSWSIRGASAGVGRIQAVGGGGAARIVTTNASGTVRACRPWPTGGSGRVTISLTARVGGVDRAEPMLAFVRGTDGAIAQLRFGRDGVFEYSSGTGFRATAVPWQAGSWTRSTIVVDEARRTYDWELEDAAGRRLLRVVGVPWMESAGEVEELCFQTSSGRAGLYAELDELRVTR